MAHFGEFVLLNHIPDLQTKDLSVGSGVEREFGNLEPVLV